jgi:hypothetical protein
LVVGPRPQWHSHGGSTAAQAKDDIKKKKKKKKSHLVSAGVARGPHHLAVVVRLEASTSLNVAFALPHLVLHDGAVRRDVPLQLGVVHEEGCQVDDAHDGKEARQAARHGDPAATHDGAWWMLGSARRGEEAAGAFQLQPPHA